MMSSGEENPQNFEGALFYHVNVNGIRTRITRIVLSNSPDDTVNDPENAEIFRNWHFPEHSLASTGFEPVLLI